MIRFRNWKELGSIIEVLLIGGFCPGQVTAAEALAVPKPGRIVNRYALTITHDSSVHDPTAWRLLGSNDDGASWTLLDVRTNQTFVSRSERRYYRVHGNAVAFSRYRLQIDRVTWQDEPVADSEKSVQLADIEFLGPVVGVDSESELDSYATSSQAHPLIGPPENAFDNEPRTRWMDYGLAHLNQCWIECQYGGRSSQTLTNLDQVQTAARGAVTRENWLERAPRILSNLNAQTSRPVQSLTAYALTSANDIPARDPRDWRVLGSNNEGKSWTLLDQRRGETFSSRFQRRVFNVTNQTAYAWYRLEIDATLQPGNFVQLSEFEPLPWKKGPDGSTLVFSARTDNPPMEAIEMAFDGDAKTKWLSFYIPQSGEPNWIQWQWLSAEPDLPLVNRTQLDRWADQQLGATILADVGKTVCPLSGYALTSANDYPSRDPSAWRLWGSRDEGRNWELLDTRRDERFPERFQRRVFTLPQPATFPLYRLQIDTVGQPAEANSVQLAEFEPLSPSGHTNRGLTFLVSAQGENPPYETVMLAFDRKPSTKWLDFANDTNRSSWIEWRYADIGRSNLLALNFDHLRATGPRSAGRTDLCLEAVVVSWDAVSNRLGLIDATGFQLFELGHSVSVEPGQRVRLGGSVVLGRDLPLLLRPELIPLGKLSDINDVRLAAPFLTGLPCLTGSIQGRLTGYSPGQYYSTLHFTAENGLGRMQARILGVSRLPLPSSLDFRIRIHGVIEPAFGEQGKRVPTTIWAAGMDALELAPPTDQEWNYWLKRSIESLWAADSPWARLICARGTVVRQCPGEWLVLGQDTNHLTVLSSQRDALTAGTPAEAVGFLVRESGAPVLLMAHYRQAPAETASTTAATSSPGETNEVITAWRQLRELIRTEPNRERRVRLQGTITYIDLALSDFYLQDGVNGIQCDGQFAAGLSPFQHQEGTFVELEGIVRQNILYPTAFAKMLGKGQFPRPLRRSWDSLMTGRADGLWVEIEGVVSAVEKQRLTLKVAGGQLIVWVKDLDHVAQKALLGSLVRANGVCSPVYNSRRQRLGLRLLVPSGECIELVNAAPEDPFKLPSVPIGQIMQREPDSPELPAQLVKTTGVVTYQQPRLLFIQDGGDGLRVSLARDPKVLVGDRIEVVGLPEPDGFSPKLTQATVRKLEAASLPSPDPIDLLDADSASLLEQRDATRGQLEATLRTIRATADLQVLELQYDKTRQTFSAFLPLPAQRPPLLPGSHLRLKGVFKARRDVVPDVDQTVTSFEMYLNSPADITVLSHPSWWTARHTAWVFGGLGTVLLLVLAWVGSLRNQVRQRTRELNDEIEDRKRAQTQLETEISERERMQLQVEKTHRDLVLASRQAGMAEVATSVLHNVGNVLNSVNVSASLLEQRIKRSKAPNLLKAAAMVRAHQSDLGDFLNNDPKGRQLPGYLIQVSEHIAGDQAEAQREVLELTKNIEHIKDIVAMQQDYARVSGLKERIRMADLVEDALRMNAGALQRHDVHLVRQYSPDVPEVIVDKHKVLQVLVNLIRNAKYACDDSGRTDKRLTVQISHSSERVRVAISDNGVGIPPENLTRIFSYGFTTRKNGHGFGLHSGALAAKELGGTLQAHSDGPGQGATFTLELPLAYKS